MINSRPSHHPNSIDMDEDEFFEQAFLLDDDLAVLESSGDSDDDCDQGPEGDYVDERDVMPDAWDIEFHEEAELEVLEQPCLLTLGDSLPLHTPHPTRVSPKRRLASQMKDKSTQTVNLRVGQANAQSSTKTLESATSARGSNATRSPPPPPPQEPQSLLQYLMEQYRADREEYRIRREERRIEREERQQEAREWRAEMEEQREMRRRLWRIEDEERAEERDRRRRLDRKLDEEREVRWMELRIFVDRRGEGGSGGGDAEVAGALEFPGY
ncbi:hypothetical protein HDU81_001932 [Chytriomyces hyalinus]|nr:hypothetical protein HDU81_001932 [Chytriomyces hyalinus]